VDVWDAGGRTSLLQRREKGDWEFIETPSVSLKTREIRQLEKELGMPLFHRRTRGVELTDTRKADARGDPRGLSCLVVGGGHCASNCNYTLQVLKRPCSGIGQALFRRHFLGWTE